MKSPVSKTYITYVFVQSNKIFNDLSILLL